MEIVQNLNAATAVNTLACLLVAFVLGSLIGLERQYRQRNARLRTNALVTVGSAVFEATLAMAFVLAANTLLRPAVNWINRKPIDDKSSEVTYTLCVIADRDVQQAVMVEVESLLDAHHYEGRPGFM